MKIGGTRERGKQKMGSLLCQPPTAQPETKYDTSSPRACRTRGERDREKEGECLVVTRLDPASSS